MEKLIELLNEYDEGGSWNEYRRIGLGCEDHNTIGYKDKNLSCEQDEIVAYLISKSYGFIKRLVENDKINEDVLDETENIVAKVNKGGVIGFYKTYEQLLMLLAISDSPIDDLISYLK